MTSIKTFLHTIDITDPSGPINVVIAREDTGAGGPFERKEYRVSASDFPHDLVITVTAIGKNALVDYNQSPHRRPKKREADMNDMKAWEEVIEKLEAKLELAKPASQPPSQ